MTNVKSDKFRELVQKIPPKTELAIFITQIDPDAVGASVTLSYILNALNPELEIQIYYCGEVGHPQNRGIINRYNLKTQLAPVSTFLSVPNLVTALVDSSLAKDSRLPVGVMLSPTIVIDHHRDSDIDVTDNNFVWVEDIGSSCTLLTELFRSLGMEFTQENHHLASLLAMGIYTDTKALVGSSARDREAYGHVTQFVDSHELQSLIDYPLPDSHYKNLASALTNFRQTGSKVIVSLGTIEPEDGDDLSTIADYFLRKDGVTLVVVWGIIKDTVRISARNSNISRPLDEFLKVRFGSGSGAKLTPDGKGEGGARLKLDLGLWMSTATKDLVEQVVSARIEELILKDS